MLLTCVHAGPDADVVISSFSHGIALSEGEITVHINISVRVE